MAEATAQEKTEPPTLKKREDARKSGQVAFSREVTSAALLGMFSLYFLVAGEFTIGQMKRFWKSAFEQITATEFTAEQSGRLFIDTITAVMPIVVGLFALAIVVGLMASLLQVGFMINALKFRSERINPLNGLKRIFSAQGLAELFKSLFKMTVIGYVTYASYQEEILPLLNLSRLPPEGIVMFNFRLVGTMFGRVALALIILAVFDYLFQRWNLDQRLKMTRQELKEEMKQTEGDPQLRARVRQIQREISRSRMMENVPKADVVVTNPTHYAVALLYDREAMTAPRLVAKGADFIAQRIREVALENDVTLVENPFVARELYHNVEVGQEIPDDFFRAVAEILAFVYRLQGKTVAPSA